MNDETPEPFGTVGDQPVEARIVAWVLGESSAFEAAELERLCEERPELLVFRRRMRALHGLLTEAEASEADHSWKLPPEKRKALDEIFGEEKPIRLEVDRDRSSRWSGRRMLLAIAACLALGVMLVKLYPRGYESQAVIEIRPRTGGMDIGFGNRGNSNQGKMTPQFFGTEFEKIKSRSSLAKVVDDLDLMKRWNVDKEEAISRLKRNVTAENIKGTDLIAVRARAKDEQDSREIVLDVVKKYRDYREELDSRDTAKALAELNKAVRDQEDKVEERRKVLATIVRTKGILYKGQDSFYGQSGINEDMSAQEALQSFNELETQKMQLEGQINTLLKYDSDELMRYASGVDLPENVIRDIYPQKLEASRVLNDLKIQGLGDRHPSVIAAQEQNQAMERQLDEGVVNLRATLQAQLKLANDRLAKVDSRKDKIKEEAIGRGLDAQDYVDAKRDFETDQELLQTMRLAQINKTIQGKMPDESVIIHEMPEAGRSWSSTAATEVAFARPATPAASVPMTLPKKKSAGLKESLDDKARGRMAEAGQAHPPAVALESQLAVLEDSSPMEAMTSVAGQAIGGGLVGGRAKGFGMADPFAETASPVPAELAINEPSRITSRSDSRWAGSARDGASMKAPAAASSSPPMPTLAAKDASESPVGNNLNSFGLAVADSGKNAASQERKLAINDADGAMQRLSNSVDRQNMPMGRPVALLAPITDSASKANEAIVSNSEFAYQLTEGESIAGDKIRGTETDAVVEKPKAKPAKQPLLIETMDEVSASGDPYSTFSLNISDASFQLAKAALAKGERPDPASIKPEQFYNAVDYGDAAPSTSEPVTATIEQSAHPVIPGRNLVRVALRTASVGRAASQPLRLTLLVDQSGSMVREDRRAAMEHALTQLGGLLTENDVVTIVGFSRKPHLLADRLSGGQANKLGDIINQAASEGGTNLEEAMKLGGQMAERQQLAGAQNRIVLFTDGAANLGNADPDRLSEQVTALRQKGIAFDIAGIGADGLNDRLLGDLARHGNGRYYVVGDGKDDSFARQLAGAFRPAAENVKVQVIFNPLRVGNYKLLGFEKDRLKTEDFRNDSVDAAELAADEAGVALYQVEALPEGKGEIGEISVRFRETASGEMVERTWTIPHDTSSPAFDRATQSMQLAGLSLLAAEKLRGGPLAGAIDFKEFAAPIAEVRRFYQSSPRVGEMLQVIDAIK